MTKVSQLFCYPLKSAKAVQLRQAPIGKRGIMNDREFCVADEITRMFVAQREDKGRGIAVRRMCLIAPEMTNRGLFLNGPDPNQQPLRLDLEFKEGKSMLVQIWDNWVLGVDQGDEAADWISQILNVEREGKYRIVRFYPYDGRLTKQGNAQQAFHDGYQVLVGSEETLTDLNRRLQLCGGKVLPMNRFRPNVVLTDCMPYAEDYMARIRVGDVHLAGQTLCVRCSIPKINQSTSEVDSAEPTATLKQYRGNPEPPHKGVVLFRNFNFGQPQGVIRVGDQVEVLEWNNPWEDFEVDWNSPQQVAS